MTSRSQAGYPGTKAIPATSYLLSLLALKLTATRRVSHVDDLLTDPAPALLTGLSILPKKTALTAQLPADGVGQLVPGPGGQHLQMIRGGIRPGAAAAHHPGQRLTGVIAVPQQGVMDRSNPLQLGSASSLCR